MSVPPAPQPIYLACEPDPAFATLHPVSPGWARDTAVILSPPFGWDEVSAYRSLREWAARLAQQGYPVIRLSFPATGDSGGSPRQPGRLAAWSASVGCAAGWLRSATGARRVVVIGLGLGGLVAYVATAGGAPIDDLVLWGTPARGRALVRALRAFSKLEASLFFAGLELPPPLPDGELEAGGFLLSAATVQELERLDLSTLALTDPSARRVLLLERDGIAVDQRLREQLQHARVSLTIAPGDGYASLTSHPQQTRAPTAVIERVSAWLGEASGPSRSGAVELSPASDLPAGASRTAGLHARGSAVHETPVTIRQPFGSLAGVLVEPVDRPRHGLCVVLLNAGAVRRIGPSRIWVEVARHWAARGVPTLRLDVEGIGDADGDGTPYTDDGCLYVEQLIPQVVDAIDFLQARGVGERFVLGGLCAGAYWAFHAALSDPRVCAALMINPQALVWDTGLGPARDLRALVTEPLSLTKLRRVATRSRVQALGRWLLGSPMRWLARLISRDARAARAGEDIDALLEQLRASGKRALFLFSEHEPLHAELVSSGRMSKLRQSPNVTLEHIRVRDHTMRPNWAQHQMREVLDRALDRELDRADVPTA